VEADAAFLENYRLAEFRKMTAPYITCFLFVYVEYVWSQCL